ncbi:MAG: hypothetical protein ACYTEW_27235 [Planctomycetota bacterium]|jgi:hypothetical protein
MESIHTHKCANCGYHNRIKVALFSAEKDKPHRASSPGMFHSTEQWNATKKVPTGGISSFIHRVILGRPLQYQPPPQTHIHVSSEVKTSRTQMLMNEMDIPLSDQQAALGLVACQYRPAHQPEPTDAQ